ncbi:isochorismatase family protein [Borrelia sp. RT1S]|uniref:isochorismatase family protein n=1 Tax=Borrelia sp. RT1S TaxID=2898580 RepID=UPI001E423977|nr:isochorismatase family protein [Borrelia sp. RT1S]UGQ17785.1 isochorismatase family protein [Borrelia sp. RT1S]
MNKPQFNFVLKNSALILVDIQNDFLESGTLPVPQSNEIIPLLNQLQSCFVHVVATKDWHCKNHISFLSKKNNKGWPEHCIRNTWGSNFPNDLNTEKIKAVFFKGQNEYSDSYSGFYDDHTKSIQTSLLTYLRSNSIDTVFVAGLALDLCVKATIIDAHSLGLRSYLVVDAVRGTSPSPKVTIQELKQLGISTCTSKDILNMPQTSP